MKKEDLIALGLTEEQVDKVIAGYGPMIPKARFDEVNDAKKQLENQIGERDTQLNDLKKQVKDNEELTTQIQQLQDANKQTKTEFEQKLKEAQLNSAIKLALAKEAQDVDIVATQLDKSIIQLNEDGTVKAGLNEQITSLKENKPFLFVNQQQQIGNAANPGTPPKPDPITKEQFNKMTYNERLKIYESSPELFKKLTQSE